MVSCLGSLVQSCCGEGGALQTNTTGVRGEHSHCSGHTGFAPAHGVCFPCPHCSGSRLLSRERALRCVDFPGLSRSDSGFRVLHKSTDSVGPAFCAVPVRAAQASRSLTGALSPGAVRLLPSAVPALVSARVRCALCLFLEAGLKLRPSRRMSTIQNLRKSLVRNWRPVCSVVGDAVFGAEFAPPPPPPTSRLWRGRAGLLPASSSLDLLRSFVL